MELRGSRRARRKSVRTADWAEATDDFPYSRLAGAERELAPQHDDHRLGRTTPPTGQCRLSSERTRMRLVCRQTTLELAPTGRTANKRTRGQ